MKIKKDINLAPFTTYKIGGNADYFFVAKNKNELVEAIEYANKSKIPFFVLGTGANILIGDKGFRGLVIQNKADNFQFDNCFLIAESGARIENLIEASLDRELSGLEHFAGIPSSVGGAMHQNLHFLSPDRKDTIFIESIVKEGLVLENGEIKKVGKDYFRFGYDESILHHKNSVVLEITFELLRRDFAVIKKQIDLNLEWRNGKQPQLSEFPSCGSVFKKIEGIGAGRLIDEAGLKGKKIGGAKVSEKHANYIVNLSEAKAKDVKELVEFIQKEVKNKTGYLLEPEVEFVGEF